MALSNPRAANDYTEIRSKNTTFKRKLSSTGAIDYLKTLSNPYPATTSTQQGQAVTMDTTDTVKTGAAGDRLVGKLITAEADGFCSVQTQGIAPFSYVANGTAPTVGRGVVLDGAGGVRVAAASSEFNERGMVLRLDATNLLAWVDLDIL